MNKSLILIKDYKRFPTGSYAYFPTRDLKTGEDVIQLQKELGEKYRLHKNK